MRVFLRLGAAVLLIAVSMQAQETKQAIIGEDGPPSERASTRVLYWNQETDSAAGQLAIDYGRPAWKKDYEDPAKFDAMTKGKVWRMGRDFWTVLDTSLPLKISGKDVQPGYYYLGLSRSADGSKWSLAFIDPVKARAARLDAFEMQKTSVEFEIPMAFEKTSTPAEKLTLSMSYPKETPEKVTLQLAWGNYLLSAPIEVTLAK
ncbi:MAG: DUF2911 domain-containing protein [Acidobacteria bacterium]|nr:DUF2911 domain-containing protein [Acidobacteriota bacterium]MBI1983453.1 DUF2911 domain-containing protein [Acidobacteriota bacterium]